MYTADENWKSHFKSLAVRACCILMQVDESISLSWELGILKEEKIHQKLFILTKPTSGMDNNPIPWARFARALNALGYLLPDEDPGPGAVIVFDEQLTGVVVAKGAIFPDDFTGAIQKWRLHRGLIRPGEATSLADYVWGIERGQNGQFSRYVRRILRKRGADPERVSEEEARNIVSRYESVRRIIRGIRLRRYEGEEKVPYIT